MRTLLVFLLIAGCGGSGGPAFGITYPDNVQADIAGVLSRLAAATPSEEPALAALLTSNSELHLVDLQGQRSAWSVPVQSPVSAPHIAGDAVVLHEQAGIVVRRVQDGRTIATLSDAALHLAGADGQGSLTAISLTTGGGVGARSQLILIDGGSVKWSKDIDQATGAPAVAAGMVFVPWATQNVSVIDADSGAEIARIRITDAPVGRAMRHGREVYFGQRGLFRLTEAIREGSRGGTAYFEPLLRDIPGRPDFMVDPYRPAPPPDSALHRVRYGWHPAGEGETVRLADDLLYGAFYRIVFGLHPSEDSVRWVYEHDRDIVGLSAQEGGLLIADDGGGFHFVTAAEGVSRWSFQQDVAPIVVTLRADRFTPSGPAAGDPRSLHDQLLSAAQNTDSRLVPARALAIHMLRGLPEADVTGHLVALCDDRQLPGELRQEACSSVEARTNGAEHILTALERHARFLEGTTVPPIAALARAAAAMNEARAVPLLIAHLGDPETPLADLIPLIEAMKTLEARAAVEPLTDFLRLYHAEATSDEMVAVMGATAEALVALQGPAAEEAIQQAAEDALAPLDLRNRLRAVLTAMAEAAEAEGETEGEGEGETEGEGEEEADGPDPRPDRVTAQVVQHVLSPVREEMAACVRADSGNAPNARLVIRLSGSGELEALSVQPTRLQSCIEPLVRRVAFPANRQNVREQVSYTVRR